MELRPFVAVLLLVGCVSGKFVDQPIPHSEEELAVDVFDQGDLQGEDGGPPAEEWFDQPLQSELSPDVEDPADEDLQSELSQAEDDAIDQAMQSELSPDLVKMDANKGFTAGNTICRSGHSCDYHGQSYSWCYTDFKGGWARCCTDDCAQRGEAYLWCHSGNKWEYCGDGGTVAADGRACVSNHPCGLHGGKNFWCYTDSKGGWAYCCAPKLVTSKHTYGCHVTKYRWCWASYRTDKWAHCKI